MKVASSGPYGQSFIVDESIELRQFSEAEPKIVTVLVAALWLLCVGKLVLKTG